MFVKLLTSSKKKAGTGMGIVFGSNPCCLHLPQELQRRCDTLIRLVEKENEDLDARDAAKAGRKGAGSKGGVSSSKEGGSAGGAGKKRKSVGAGGPGLKKGRTSESPAPGMDVDG